MTVWDSVLAITEDMLRAAHAGDFDRVATLDIERRALINRPIVTDGQTTPVLAKLVECDRALVAIVDDARRFAGEQLRQARIAQAGAGRYLGIAFAR